MADEREESGQERTESPTPRRREEARREGRIARSPELTAAVALLAGTMALAGFGGSALAGQVVRLFQDAAQALTLGPLSVEGASMFLRNILLGTLLALLPFGAAVMAAVVVIGLVQTRGTVSGGPLRPQLSRLNPLEGVKRMLGIEGIANLLKASLKLLALGTVTWLTLRKSWPELTALSDVGAAETFLTLRHLVVRLVLTTGLAFLVIAALDYLYQLYRHEKSLKMTRQELIREMRESEGDPMVKSRIQSIARARARQRMLQAVPKADVVVVNPTHIAVALRYDPLTAPAPIVVAMGERKIAERIKAIAAQAGVPIVENRPVARALIATAVVGKPIPPALYAAVAEILAFVYRRRRGALPAGVSR